jgi:2-keto-4-pentenoate hydratase/2-oxohepta-3-ene-1,7-dioic acid hydratase in catechol pathway
VDTEFSPIDRLVTVHVNGEMRQMASTRDMVYDIPRVISFASTFMTLEPGDLLLTGTPAGVGPLLDGDEVTVTVDGLGTLKNIVATEVRS